MTVDPMRLLECRKRAVEHLEYACKGNPVKGSPRWLEVTEGRNAPKYSSCGDLAHWMLFRLGFRMRWINRTENQGWRMGMNIARLVARGVKYTGQKLDGGDIIVISNRWPQGFDAHAVCVINQPSAGVLVTAESGLPGNGLLTHNLPLSRQIRVVIQLESVIEEHDSIPQPVTND
jgi:hypothetical protein